MKLYANKAELSRQFGLSTPTVYKYVAGIEKEIASGRYNRYAIADGLVSVAVFADYAKYRKRLEDKNMRKTVPAFNMTEALEYLDGSEYESAAKTAEEFEKTKAQVRKSLENILAYLRDAETA